MDRSLSCLISRTSLVKKVVQTLQESTETREPGAITPHDFLGHQNDYRRYADPHQEPDDRSWDRGAELDEAPGRRWTLPTQLSDGHGGFSLSALHVGW
jgi:hypothetical protein